MRQKKLSKIERLVNAAFHIGKYSAFSLVLAGSLGCFKYGLKPISSSADGRYVSFPVPVKGEDIENRCSFVIYDITNNTGERLPGTYNESIWISNTKDTLALIEEGENRKTDILVISPNAIERIPSASFPSLSKKGDALLYSKDFDSEDDPSRLELILRNLKTKKEQVIAKNAIFGDFSYDDKLISYVALEKNDKTDKDKITPVLYVTDGDSKFKEKVRDLNFRDGDDILATIPHFVGERRLIFQSENVYDNTYTSEKNKTNLDVFCAHISQNFDGSFKILTEQISPWFNLGNEFFPSYRDNVYYYIKEELKKEGEESVVSFRKMQRGSLGIVRWEIPLKINPEFYTVAKGNKIVYYGKREDGTYSIFLATPKKASKNSFDIVDIGKEFGY